MGIYHIIEWIRTTGLLSVVFMEAPFMLLWYLTSVSSLYGLAVAVYLHVVFFGADSKACSASQPTRYLWLEVEIIYFWTCFAVCSFPIIFLFIYRKDKLHEIL